MLESLLAPPFAADPPVKLNVPAKTLGLVLAILGAIAALFGIFGVFALLALSAPVIGVIIGVIGAVVGAWGGYQMYQEKREGKKYAIYGVVINVVAATVSALGGSGLVGWIFGALVSFVIYYLIVISRFPGEPPLVATTPGPSGT